ncbi:MAG: L,D-transpeptidase family protein [Candidatus Omnitrophota bacterium]|nr:L,D-transpeptidase family protein [Candidatus Omnitrophota bacterium]
MGNRFLIVVISVSFAMFIIIAALSYKVISGPADNIGARPPRPAAKSAEEAAPPKMAVKSFNQQDRESAIKNAESVITKYPDSPQAESSYFLLGDVYEKTGDSLKAKDAYQNIIEKFPNSVNVSKAQEALDDLNIKILFSPLLNQDFLVYEVRKGDTISALAKKFSTTADLITKMNGLKDNIIRVGIKLKMPKAKFSIVIDKSQNILTLKSDGEIIKTYKVSTGKNSCTPVGNFTITNKIVDPPWYPSTGGVIKSGDPKNVLGSRWLGLSKPSYGIHGTIEPESIGRSVTEGCVRMKNSDVEELSVIVPEGTEVVIMD